MRTRTIFLGALAGAALCTANAEDSESAWSALENDKNYALPAAEIVVLDVLLNRVDNQVFSCCDYRVTSDSVRRNLRSSWVIDHDPFRVNQLGHPYQGSMYHTFARSAGLGYWEGLAYTFLGSAFWEVAGETTLPSRNDQITTGIGGSFLGEALFRMSSFILEKRTDHPVIQEVVAAIVSPATGFNRNIVGGRYKAIFPSHDPARFARLQVGYSGTVHDEGGEVSSARLRRNEGVTDFLFEYGLPGKRSYEYTRPFDYFSFQASATTANGFENVMTRGLLKGRPFSEGESLRGVLGLYGSYDYIYPQTFRVSATGLSLGTTLQWQMSHSWILQATGLAGGGYTAVGTVNSSVDADYHYGLAPQALAALRFIWNDRAALDLTAREYYVTRIGAAARGGHENIGRVDAALTWRLLDRHGISIKYLGNFRDAFYPATGNTSQRRATLGIFYTLLGHEKFGAVSWR